ncbi:MAG TPA: UDP-N-acetylmuramoyl-L-alanyl-D-glutamate--2,6-diaminopimelate ligase [Anaerolineae bacterium]|nr:UDP-N-acetylmuramoyl-L-alanyl-D-glutamate--2,6-diaminopimelate ligase [Anaerolineae bacterium]
MRWGELRVALQGARLVGDGEAREIRAIVADSRQAGPGALFVAVPGVSVDGHRYLADALGRGAVAAVVERAEALPAGLPGAVVTDARAALAQLAAAWHGYPSRRLRVVGVTGTEGKTTTIELIASILSAAGLPAGMVSTVKARIGGQEIDTGLHTTTPDAPDMQRYLAQMVEQGARYALIEATSHGLAQRRVDACDFDVAVVTNITRDHLDYHGTFEAYRDAKAMLVRHLAAAARKPDTPKVAVLNVDDPSFGYLRGIPADRYLTYSLDGAADVTLTEATQQARGWRARAITPAGAFDIETPLVGRFNLYNVLAAIAAALSQGIAVSAIRAGIAAFEGVEGRMEQMDLGQDFQAVIDFAHTPNALREALEASREMTRGRVIVVYGCAGLRDRGKRPQMGEISGRLADVTVITAEDPRTEPLDAIMAEIAAGCEAAGRREGEGYWRIGDRTEAIAYAVAMARPGDLVLVTGKGHERSLCFGSTETPWSDHAALRAALTAHLERQGGPRNHE